MEVTLTPEQEAFIRQGIQNGDYRTADDALNEAIQLWQERRRTLEELRAAVDEADEDLEAGNVSVYSRQGSEQLVEALKAEARAAWVLNNTAS